jgi:transcriptional regulator with XRE-family HTH domain
MADLEKWKVVGERIGALIRLRGYKSVELFAYENDIDKSVLNRLIRGKREVRLSTFLKIAEALEIPMGELNIGSGLMVRDKEYSEAKAAKGKDGTGRVLKLTRGEFDRIEVRKSARDRNPLVSIAEQKKPPALTIQIKDVKIDL